MRKTPSKNSSKFYETADEINFLEHIESWGIQKGNPITMLEKYLHARREDWGLVNRGKVMAYAQKRLDSLRLKA